jgi:hypothetical protein
MGLDSIGSSDNYGVCLCVSKIEKRRIRDSLSPPPPPCFCCLIGRGIREWLYLLYRSVHLIVLDYLILVDCFVWGRIGGKKKRKSETDGLMNWTIWFDSLILSRGIFDSPSSPLTSDHVDDHADDHHLQDVLKDAVQLLGATSDTIRLNAPRRCSTFEKRIA